MSNIIEKIRQQAKAQAKTIVLPESEEPRIQTAAQLIQRQGIAQALVLSPDKMDNRMKEKYAQDFFALRKSKGMTLEKAREVVAQPLYYAAMMVKGGSAHGFVAGADYTTPDVARAAIRCLGVIPRIKVACSCFIMVVSDKSLGEKGVFVFADCGIVPEPNSEQLASIAVSAADLARRVLGIKPRVALLH